MKDKIFNFTSVVLIFFGVCMAGILALATEMFWPPMIGLFIAAIGASIIAFHWLRNRTTEELIRTGLPIKAEFVEVSLNQTLEVNGRNPFQIIAQWHDESTNEVHLFKSRNIWFDPTSFIKSNDLTVYLDSKGRRKYYMDISFLPKLATGS